MTDTVTLGWPPLVLNPNMRVHWAKKAKAAKAYREACGWACRGAKLVCGGGPVTLAITFYPPDRRHRDVDNLVASIKSGLDGVADALGIDDRLFSIEPMLHHEIGGFVRVRLV